MGGASPGNIHVYSDKKTGKVPCLFLPAGTACIPFVPVITRRGSDGVISYMFFLIIS
jgi:hypothetical protein